MQLEPFNAPADAQRTLGHALAAPRPGLPSAGFGAFLGDLLLAQGMREGVSEQQLLLPAQGDQAEAQDPLEGAPDGLALFLLPTQPTKSAPDAGGWDLVVEEPDPLHHPDQPGIEPGADLSTIEGQRSPAWVGPVEAQSVDAPAGAPLPIPVVVSASQGSPAEPLLGAQPQPPEVGAAPGAAAGPTRESSPSSGARTPHTGTTPSASVQSPASTTQPELEQRLEPPPTAPIDPPAPRREVPGREPTSALTPAGSAGPAEEPRVPTAPRTEEAAQPQRTGDELAGQVLQQVRVGLDARRRTALIRLDPPELGRVSIHLEVDAGRVRAIVRAESPATLELLERHLPELRAALALEGLEADELALGRWSGREQSAGRDAEEQLLAPPRHRRAPASPDHPASAEPAGLLPLGPGLDTYA